MKKYILLILYIAVFLGIERFPFTYYYHFDNPIDALKYKGNVDQVIDQVTIDNVIIYFYLTDEGSLIHEYVYKDDKGYRSPTKDYDKYVFGRGYNIYHTTEKNGSHIIVFDRHLSINSNFIVSDNINSEFHEVKFEYKGYVDLYYIAVIEEIPDDYKLYVNSKEVEGWKCFALCI